MIKSWVCRAGRRQTGLREQQPTVTRRSGVNQLWVLLALMSCVDGAQATDVLGLGSVAGADNLVLTSERVVRDATNVTVKSSDGNFYGAHVIGVDKNSGLAVLKVEHSFTMFAPLRAGTHPGDGASLHLAPASVVGGAGKAPWVVDFVGDAWAPATRSDQVALSFTPDEIRPGAGAFDRTGALSGVVLCAEDTANAVGKPEAAPATGAVTGTAGADNGQAKEFAPCAAIDVQSAAHWITPTANKPARSKSRPADLTSVEAMRHMLERVTVEVYGERNAPTRQAPDDELTDQAQALRAKQEDERRDAAVYASARAHLAWQKQQFDDAMLLAIKAIRLGSTDAQNLLGVMCERGQGQATDLSSAARWYSAAALAGQVDAQNNLARLLLIGAPGLQRDEAEAMALFRKSAGKGSARGQFELGRMYAEGRGVDVNVPDAIIWYQLAAEQGMEAAQLALAGLYLRGEGIARDTDEARQWLDRSVQQGSVRGQSWLGYLNLSDDKAPDYAKAQSLLTQAAEHGAVDAQANLAYMYLKGVGLKSDSATGLKWLRKAAEAGDAQSMYSLGMLLQSGQVGRADPREAKIWLQKAQRAGVTRLPAVTAMVTPTH